MRPWITLTAAIALQFGGVQALIDTHHALAIGLFAMAIIAAFSAGTELENT